MTSLNGCVLRELEPRPKVTKFRGLELREIFFVQPKVTRSDIENFSNSDKSILEYSEYCTFQKLTLSTFEPAILTVMPRL